MQSEAETIEEYLQELPEDRREVVSKIREVILENIDPVFEECMNYGMIGYVVPHSVYPAGYHCDPKLPLPFMNLASQKRSVNLYNSCLYESNLLEWWKGSWDAGAFGRLDMGKCCIRFKKLDRIPYSLIGELAGKTTASEWIEIYEKSRR